MSAVHWLAHNLDLVAACLTGASTVLLAHRRRSGFLVLVAGSLVWTGVALLARLGGRPVWWQVVSSVWTCGWAVWGWRTWRIDARAREE